MRGYVYIPLLISVLIAFGFVLSGGLILSKKSSSTVETNEQYTLVEAEPLPSHSTLQLSTLDFTATKVCGLNGFDIALVIDKSNSINPNRDKMVNDLKSFVSSFSGSTTQFSVTKFSTTAEVIQGFTDNLDQVNNAIGLISLDGTTNWEDALTKAKGTLPNRPSNPDLIIFASDGNPNTIIPDKYLNNGVIEALNRAITVADIIKSNGATILTLGIGSDIFRENLEKISGTTSGPVLDNYVILTDFNNLAANLAAIAGSTCESN